MVSQLLVGAKETHPGNIILCNMITGLLGRVACGVRTPGVTLDSSKRRQKMVQVGILGAW